MTPVALPIVLPLAAAALSLVLHQRLRYQRLLSLVAVTATAVVCTGLLLRVTDGGVVVGYVGGWPAGVGITLAVDLLGALVLEISIITVLCVLVFAIGQLDQVDEARYFHPLYLVLTAGVSAAFITGDLFNLFVAFEITLIASYVLLTMASHAESIRPAMTYVVVNLLASTLFITAVALLYAATGTVNMADLAQRVGALPDGLQTALRLLLLVVFGIKAAIFPLFFWLPDSYPTAPTSVTAVFAGLLTKVGVYAIIRTQTILFGPADGPDTLLLTIAGFTMLAGVLGAIIQGDVKRILSFHIISQIGYMIFGLALFTLAGIAAAILYIVHHIAVKTSLFLVGGLVERMTGTSRLAAIGGLVHRLPLLAVLFAIPALSLAGLPPFSGFYGKLALVQAGLDAGRWMTVSVSLVVSLLTLFSMAKIWAGVFWGEPDELPPADSTPAAVPVRMPPLMTAATAGLVAVTLVVAVGVGRLHELSLRAAAGLVDPSAYVAAVLEGGSE